MWLCVVVVVVCGWLWLYVAVCGCTWLVVAVCGCMWLCVVGWDRKNKKIKM